LLRPVFNEHIKGRGENDGIQWLLDASGGRKTLQGVATDQLFLGIASVHTTAASALSTLYDLLDYPEYIPAILDEIYAALKDNPQWTKQSLAKLEKLDSFMKESQRMHPVGLVTVQRTAVKSYTFKDGLHLPENTQITFQNYELNHDPDLFPDPETFDGHRFLKLRQTGDPNKHHFAFVSNESINFGAGRHACPGRHFVSYEIKLLLAELLLRYEMKWPGGKSRPADQSHDFSTPPDPAAEILFKERT